MNKRLSITIGLLAVLVAVLMIAKDVNKQEESVIEETKPPVEEVIPPKEEMPVPEIEEPIEEPEVEKLPLPDPREQARAILLEKHGEDVVNAWEKLSRDEFFDYIGYKMVVQQHHGPEGEVYYYCYKILEDGTMKDAYVGGNYYIYGVFVSNEAIFDLVDYHNEFFAVE